MLGIIARVFHICHFYVECVRCFISYGIIYLFARGEENIVINKSCISVLGVTKSSFWLKSNTRKYQKRVVDSPGRVSLKRFDEEFGLTEGKFRFCRRREKKTRGRVYKIALRVGTDRSRKDMRVEFFRKERERVRIGRISYNVIWESKITSALDFSSDIRAEDPARANTVSVADLRPISPTSEQIIVAELLRMITGWSMIPSLLPMKHNLTVRRDGMT